MSGKVYQKWVILVVNRDVGTFRLLGHPKSSLPFASEAAATRGAAQYMALSKISVMHETCYYMQLGHATE